MTQANMIIKQKIIQDQIDKYPNTPAIEFNSFQFAYDRYTQNVIDIENHYIFLARKVDHKFRTIQWEQQLPWDRELTDILLHVQALYPQLAVKTTSALH